MSCMASFCQGGSPKRGRVRRSMTGAIPFFRRFFRVLARIAPSTCFKSALQFCWGHQTSSDRFWPDPEAGGSRFRLPKVPVSPQVALKTGPIHKSQILLTSRLKSTSGALPRLHSLKIAPSAQLKSHFLTTCCGEGASDHPFW